MNGATVIGNFWVELDDALDARQCVLDGLRYLLAHAGYTCGQIDLRSPSEHAQAYAEIIAAYPDGWHHEDSNCVGRYFAVWSDRVPTEVMLDDGRIFEAEDGDLILIDNLHAQHRPPNVARWFARMWQVKETNAVSYS